MRGCVDQPITQRELQVQDNGQVHLALIRMYIGNIHDPDPVRHTHIKLLFEGVRPFQPRGNPDR